MKELDGEIWEMDNGEVTAVKINGVIFKKEAREKKPAEIVMERLKEINKPEEKTKRCGICKKDISVSKFSKDKYKVDGLSYACKECLNKRQREKNMEKARLKRIEELNAPKTCVKCGETKPRDEFYNRKQSEDGKQSYCIVCQKEALSKRKAKIVRHEAKPMKETKISNGDLPLVSSAERDRKALKWSKFRIRG